MASRNSTLECGVRALHPLGRFAALLAAIAAALLVASLAVAAPAYASEPTTAYNNIPASSWTASGNCEWAIDSDGVLWIRPQNGAASGQMGEYYDSTAQARNYGQPWFDSRESITAVKVPDGKTVFTPNMCYSLFNGCANAVSIEMPRIDVSNSTQMKTTFSGCRSVTSLDLSGWDLSNKECSGMFSNCASLTFLDLSDWTCATSMKNFVGRSNALYTGDPEVENIDVSGWDLTNTTSLEACFANSSTKSITGFDTWVNGSGVTTMWQMFDGCPKLLSLDLTGLDSSGVSNFGMMFSECPQLEELDLTMLDVSNGTNFSNMFSYCPKLESLDLSGWDVRKSVPSASSSKPPAVFTNCSSLEKLDVRNWKVGGASWCFGDEGGLTACASGTDIDVTGWDLAQTTSISRVFNSSCARSIVGVDTWKNTGNVTNASLAFAYCSKLTALDASELVKGSVTNMSQMFSSSSNLANLDLSGWDVSGVTSWGSFLYGLPSLANLDLSGWKLGASAPQFGWVAHLQTGAAGGVHMDVSNWDCANTTSLSSLFANSTVSQITGLLTWKNTSQVSNTSLMFSSCSNLTELDLSGFVKGSVSNMTRMFENTPNLTVLDLSDWDVSGLASQGDQYMFASCPSLEFLDLSGWKIGPVSPQVGDSGTLFGQSGPLALDVARWDLSNASSIKAVFASTSATSITGFSSWNNSGNVTSVSEMFEGCPRLTVLDLRGFDDSGVANMSGAFRDCAELQTVNLEGWTFASVANADTMFAASPKLATIHTSPNIDLSQREIESSSMFIESESIVGGEGTPWKEDVVDKAYARVDGLNGAPGYFTAYVVHELGEDGAADVILKHEVLAGASVDISDIAYTIHVESRDVLGPAERETGCRAPASHISATPVVFSGSDSAAWTRDAWSAEATRGFTIAGLLGGEASALFEQPGVYIFDVTETASGGSSSDASKWSWTSGAQAPESYALRVYVVNDEATGGLRYDEATLEELTNNTLSKVDAAAFSSAYTAWQPLVIEKQVAGDYGNKVYDFSFEATFYLPEWYDPDTAAVEAPAGATVVSAPAQAGGAGPWVGTYAFALSDDESISFTVPVGTVYKIEEKNAVAGLSEITDDVGIEYGVGIGWTVDFA